MSDVACLNHHALWFQQSRNKQSESSIYKQSEKACINSQKACPVCPYRAHCKRLTDQRREKAQTFTVGWSGSASTSLRVAVSSAASASQLKWSHQDRFKTLFAAVNVSTVRASSLNERGLQVYTSGMHSRAHAVLQCSRTEMWEKRAQLIWHWTLPPSILLSSRHSSFLCHSSHSTLPSCCPCLALTLSPCTKWIASASSYLPFVLMPVIDRFQQECERGRDKETDTAWSKTSVGVFIWDWGSLCFEGSTNPHPLWNKQLLACTREGSTASMRTGGWEVKIWRGSIILSAVYLLLVGV